MAESDQQWADWLARLCTLRVNKSGTKESPHKPVLILSIIDLLDRGLIQDNIVPLTDRLIAAFKRYFEVVAKGDDRPTINNPFFYLRSDGFWHLIPRPGCPAIDPSRAPSVSQLQQQVSHGTFDAGFWALIATPLVRHQVREALIARYFPESRRAIAALVIAPSPQEEHLTLQEKLPPVASRDAAFRRIVLEVYDHRCAACDLRIFLDHTLSLVEAAHLIPFAVSWNDNPTNGIALCPNHHWAMDQHLIAPCPDVHHPTGVWRVNEKRLKDRKEQGQLNLLNLEGREVSSPKDTDYSPAPESLLWRREQLLS